MATTPRPAPALLFSLLLSAGLLVALTLAVRGHPVSTWEKNLFLLLNQLPAGAAPALVALTQLGAYPAIYVAGLAAARRLRLALHLLVAGNLGYWIAVWCRRFVARPRPGELLPHVRFHDGATGVPGYPSGHMAVATALGMVAAAAIPRRWRPLLWAAIAGVGVARVYVGAHLPLDVVGGFLVGWLAASLTRLVLAGGGVPSRTHLRDVLRSRGLAVEDLALLPGDRRGSLPYRATTTDGRVLFVKVTRGEQRDADWLYRLYRRLRRRTVAPYLTAGQKTEHEALMSLLAERGGVRTPPVVTTVADRAGNPILVEEFVPGATLDPTDRHTLDALADVWAQVAALHRARMAHGDLRVANVLRRGSAAYLVGLGFAEADAPAGGQARDLPDLLVAGAHLAGAERSVSAAVTALGRDAVAAALPFVRRSLLSHRVRAVLPRRSRLLEEVRSEIARQCRGTAAGFRRINRRVVRRILALVTLGAVVYFLLPQVGEAHTAVRALVHARPLATLGSLAAAAATYPLSALALRAAAGDRVPLGPTVAVQVAAAFANRVAPGAVGGLSLSIRYLQRRGLSVPVAVAAAGTARAAGVVSVVLLLPVLLPFARQPTRHVPAAAKSLPVLLTVVVVLLLIAGALAVPRLRARSRAVLRQVTESLRSLVRSGRVLRLVGVSLGLSLAYGACLYLALLAVGTSVSAVQIPQVLLVCLVGEGVATAAPTPGGLGATEAALVSGLLIYGIPAEAAVAGVLIYRIGTFWLPIVPGFFAFQALVRRGYV